MIVSCGWSTRIHVQSRLDEVKELPWVLRLMRTYGKVALFLEETLLNFHMNSIGCRSFCTKKTILLFEGASGAHEEPFIKEEISL